MLAARKRRLGFIIILMVSLSGAVALAMFALRKNIDLYYTPSQALKQKISPDQELRLGGYVLKGSVHHQPHSLVTRFMLSDFHRNIIVIYDGLLPSLFREGQGVIAEGKLQPQGVFIADQVLAKHDSTYRPPGFPTTDKHTS